VELNWNEISKWAKSNDFKMSKKDGKIVWAKVDEPEISGSSESVEDAAKSIFNSLTGNRWVEYQEKYKSPG
jgi:hypothetical protein